jgi:hypothetical protein
VAEKQLDLFQFAAGCSAKLRALCRCRHNRHRFAVETLLRWYRSGEDVRQRLPILSTYLGHVHVTDTYWYLSNTPELMAAAGDRLEKRWEEQR